MTLINMEPSRIRILPNYAVALKDVMYNRCCLRQSGTILPYSDYSLSIICRCVVVAKFRRPKNTKDAPFTNS